MTTIVQLIIGGGILFMLFCVVGLVVEMNRLRAKARSAEEDAAFYRKWLNRALFRDREDLFV
jgi:hypothetical protein